MHGGGQRGGERVHGGGQRGGERSAGGRRRGVGRGSKRRGGRRLAASAGRGSGCASLALALACKTQHACGWPSCGRACVRVRARACRSRVAALRWPHCLFLWWHKLVAKMPGGSPGGGEAPQELPATAAAAPAGQFMAAAASTPPLPLPPISSSSSDRRAAAASSAGSRKNRPALPFRALLRADGAQRARIERAAWLACVLLVVDSRAGLRVAQQGLLLAHAACRTALQLVCAPLGLALR